jgi:hypothetical protein
MEHSFRHYRVSGEGRVVWRIASDLGGIIFTSLKSFEWLQYFKSVLKDQTLILGCVTSGQKALLLGIPFSRLRLFSECALYMRVLVAPQVS